MPTQELVTLVVALLSGNSIDFLEAIGALLVVMPNAANPRVGDPGHGVVVWQFNRVPAAILIMMANLVAPRVGNPSHGISDSSIDFLEAIGALLAMTPNIATTGVSVAILILAGLLNSSNLVAYYGVFLLGLWP
ncbi:hypothetical protein AMTR_s00024p00050530 [Amborella trichopoda]|uniref:Uncharacterized protein n=1 Tax=Amborella trichopoda TaxID=13333 RepID=W1PTI7_AMBTC|nr:hypothetical protein AMTR_s00024p00050530 [Amborella trichopoda]